MTDTRYNLRSPGKTRGDHLLQELEHDPYHSKLKLSEPTVCPECSAVYLHGRWQWADTPEAAHETLCPACARIRDKLPAGFLSVGGEFFRDHREEILRLIEHTIEKEKAEHPLKRLMGAETQDEGEVFTFTDPHLVHGVGHALRRAYKGDLDIQYQPGEYMVRANWNR